MDVLSVSVWFLLLTKMAFPPCMLFPVDSWVQVNLSILLWNAVDSSISEAADSRFLQLEPCPDLDRLVKRECLILSRSAWSCNNVFLALFTWFKTNFLRYWHHRQGDSTGSQLVVWLISFPAADKGNSAISSVVEKWPGRQLWAVCLGDICCTENDQHFVHRKRKWTFYRLGWERGFCSPASLFF